MYFKTAAKTALLALAIAADQARANEWPSPQYDALETLLYEGRRSDGSNLASTQHPCKLRSQTRSHIGAEWLRLAFHDSVGYDAAAGTGGMDSSIAHELDQPGNEGAGMRRSLEDFFTFSSKYISRADIIAVGTTFAVASCGGPILPFRGGRVDKYTGDQFLVPQPGQGVDVHTEIFRQQGFSREEMIGLVACGHTMGGVTVSEQRDAFPPNEADRIAQFDTTKQFDNAVATEFVAGTSANPLVNVPSGNTTLAADQRIFNADNGATIRGLTSPEAFQQTCATLLTRMLELVPRNVQLTPQVVLNPAKVNSAQLTIEKGQLVYKMSFRVAEKVGKSISSKRKVTMYWCDRYGDDKDCVRGVAKSAAPASKRTDESNISPITERLGVYFAHYNFVVPIDAAKSISKFWVTIDENDGSPVVMHNNGGAKYHVPQDNILYVASLGSSRLDGSSASSKTFRLVAAVKSSLSPSRVYMTAFDSALPDYGPPLNRDIDLTINTSLEPIAGYTFYSGEVQDVGAQLTVDMHAVIDGQTYTEDYQQTFFLDSRSPSSPPTAVLEVSTQINKSNAAQISLSNYGISLGLFVWMLSLLL